MSHLQGTDYVGSHGGHGGRPGPAQRVPPLQDQDGRPERRLRGHGRGPDPAAHRLPGRAGQAGRGPPPPLRLPAPAAPGRRGQGPARRGHPGPRGARPGGGDPGGGAGQAVRGGVSAGPGRPDADPPDVRGPLPAAADPRRGPPLRHHLPPQAAGQADDRVGARRHPRPRPGPPEAAAQGARRAARRCGRRRSRRCKACRGCPTRWRGGVRQGLPGGRGQSLAGEGARRRAPPVVADGTGGELVDASGDHGERRHRRRAATPRAPRSGRTASAPTAVGTARSSPPGGRTGSPEGPTPSTPSSSCRWPPPTWPARPRCSTSAAARARSPGWPPGSPGVARVAGVDPSWAPAD